nr:Hsp20/alpha crystallin family protein [Sinorhizobium meliloti]
MSERRYGSFQRAFRLAHALDADNIAPNFRRAFFG